MRTLRTHLLVFGLYFLLACLITWPVLDDLGAGFMGGSTSDAYEMARHIWWFKHAFQNGLDPFWQSNLGYPDGINGVSLYANILQFFPAWLFAYVLPLPVAYNLAILLAMALNGWALWFLVRYLLTTQQADPTSTRGQAGCAYDHADGAPRLAALLAGVVFMASPVFQGHLFDGHAGLMVMWPVPLWIYSLFRLVRAEPGRPAFGWLLASVFWFWLSPSGHMLQAIYVLLPVGGLFFLAHIHQRNWRAARRVLLSGVLGAAILLIFLLPVLLDTFQSEAYTGTQGYVRYSTDLLGIVTPSFQHPLFGNLEYTGRVLGVNLGEGSTYLGMIAAILCVIAVLRFRVARWWLLLAFVAWLFALGPLLKLFDQPIQISIEGLPTYITLPFAFLVDIPGFNLARTPGRFSFALALAVAVMAGYGAACFFHWLQKPLARLSVRPLVRDAGVFAVLTVLILFEYQFFWPLPTQPAELPAVFTELSQRDDVRAVFNVPHAHLLAAKDALYLQTAHQHPLIAGQVTRQTPVNPAKLDVLEHSFDPGLLHAAGADVVILHQQRAAEIGELETLQTRLNTQLGAPYYDDARYALYNVPATDESLDLVLVAPPATVPDVYEAALYGAAGWYDLRLDAATNERAVDVLLDAVRLHRWQMQAEQPAQNVSVFLPDAGYYTLALALDSPCPMIANPLLICRTLDVSNVDARYAGMGALDAVRFANGVTLRSALTNVQDETLFVRMHWQFEAGLSAQAIRFVHVADSTGEPIAQLDEALGQQAVGSQWAQQDRFDLRELPPGAYSVYVGWYSYPDIVNFSILDSAIPNAQAGRLPIGTFEIP